MPSPATRALASVPPSVPGNNSTHRFAAHVGTSTAPPSGACACPNSCHGDFALAAAAAAETDSAARDAPATTIARMRRRADAHALEPGLSPPITDSAPSSPLSPQKVGTGTTVEGVGAGTTVEQVATARTDEPVVALRADQVVTAGVSQQEVVEAQPRTVSTPVRRSVPQPVARRRPRSTRTAAEAFR